MKTITHFLECGCKAVSTIDFEKQKIVRSFMVDPCRLHEVEKSLDSNFTTEEMLDYVEEAGYHIQERT